MDDPKDMSYEEMRKRVKELQDDKQHGRANDLRKLWFFHNGDS